MQFSQAVLGTVYIPERERGEEDLRRDLQRIKDSGLSICTLWPVAPYWLHGEAGKRSWDVTDFYLDTCQTLDLKVILQLTGQNPFQEYLFDYELDDPEMLVQGDDGKRGLIGNLSHPRVQQRIKEYFQLAAARYKDHPALYAYEFFNEINLPRPQFDQYTEKYFQEWLEKNYSTIDDLNYAWRRSFRSFQDIKEENVEFNRTNWSTLTPRIDCSRFLRDHLINICALMRDWITSVDPHHLIMADMTPHCTLFNPTDVNNCDWETAKLGDIYGVSVYPKWGGRAYNPVRLAQMFSGVRSAADCYKKISFCTEMQTHYQNPFSPGSEVNPEELKQWTWMAFATGLSGLVYWRWRPFISGVQSTGRGLVNLDGSPSPRLDIVKDIAVKLKDWGEDFLLSTPPPTRAALLYSRDSALYSDVYSFDHQANFHGWFKAFFERDEPVRFLRAQELKIPDEIEILVLPCLYSVTDDIVKELKAFRSRGGILIADARLGVVNETGDVNIPIPGIGLDEIFGIEEVDLLPHKSGFLKQQLKIKNSNVIKKDKYIKYGNNYYLPTCAGLEYLAVPEKSSVNKLLGKLGMNKRNPDEAEFIRVGKQFKYHFQFDLMKIQTHIRRKKI